MTEREETPAALEGVLSAAMDDTPEWYDLARAALADAPAPEWKP